MKLKSIIFTLLLLLPITLMAQSRELSTLIESYADNDKVTYKEVKGAMLWMFEKVAPKGAMEGVERLELLIFEDDATFKGFEEKMLSIFAKEKIEQASRESDKGMTFTAYAPKGNETPSVVYTTVNLADEGATMFMAMELDPKEAAKKRKK